MELRDCATAVTMEEAGRICQRWWAEKKKGAREKDE